MIQMKTSNSMECTENIFVNTLYLCYQQAIAYRNKNGCLSFK